LVGRGAALLERALLLHDMIQISGTTDKMAIFY